VDPLGLYVNLRQVYDARNVAKTEPKDGTHMPKHVTGTPCAENNSLLTKTKINIFYSDVHKRM
jgi:hypothetical protein